MNDTARVRDLFNIAEQVRTSDFVSVLTRDVDAPERTAATYVPTPALVEAFDRALDLVGHALERGETRGAVLHGSFGSGKSHFMAMLSLILQGHEAPWRLPELHPLRDKHPFLARLSPARDDARRVLELHVHMLGKQSMEQAIFDAYLATVAASHPEAAVPALFSDGALFENAAALRARIGDEPFFSAINEAVGAGGSGLKKRKRWSAERFEAALGSADLTERRRLFDALVRSHFSAFTASGAGYLPFDQGLAALTEHAQGLGYHAVVLFLDELILWLATEKIRVVNEETPKIGILGELDGAIPIVSFLAQQKGLDEMVGDQVRGEEQARLKQLLHFWEDRFDHLKFENKNLPAVIEKRLLVPKDEAAKATLDEAFATMQKEAGRAYATLVASEDSDAFRKLYPFSPALVETLVALSAALSRHRTAIKLLAEILVDHIPDLTLGQLVLLGDVFDVLHDDMADGMIRHHLRDARKLYRSALPVIQDRHGTKTPARCQRLRDDAERRRSLGCSGCPERDCRADNRLFKTLLLAALVPGVDLLQNLTVSRLVELNHGSLRVPIAGTEASKALATLQLWEGRFVELHLGEGKDPRVWVELGGVDVEPILQQAHAVDYAGMQKDKLKQLLLDAIEVGDGEQKMRFRQVQRPGRIRFGNVRTMSEDQLEPEKDDEWLLVIDYPFDEPGHGPAEDEAKLEAYKDAGKDAWTLVWLPSFLSAENERNLRDLVRLDEILRNGETKQKYLGDLGHEKRAEAERVLETMQRSKRRTLLRALERAYGVRTGNDADIDPSRSVQQHLWLLQPGTFTARSAGSLKDAFDRHVKALLAARYQNHPELAEPLTVAKVDDLVELFDAAAAAREKQHREPDKKRLARASGILEPLGLAQVLEDVIHVSEEGRLRHVEQTRIQKNVADPTVAQIIEWADPDKTRGLRTPSAELLAALFVRAWASWQGRTFERAGERFVVEGKRSLPGDVRLRQPEMPTPSEWDKARKMASATLGIAEGKKIGHRADNVIWLSDQIRKVLVQGEAVAKLVGALERRLATLGLRDSDRLRTARSAAALNEALSRVSPVEQVRVLAAFTPQTSGTAVGASLARAAANLDVVNDDLLFGYFEPLAGDDRPAARKIVEGLHAVLRQDELHTELSTRIRQLAEDARAILRKPEVAPPSAGRTLYERRVQATGRAEIAAALEALRAAIEAADGEAITLDMTVTLRGRGER